MSTQLKDSFSGFNIQRPLCLSRRLTVSSPLTAATTILPFPAPASGRQSGYLRHECRPRSLNHRRHAQKKSRSDAESNVRSDQAGIQYNPRPVTGTRPQPVPETAAVPRQRPSIDRILTPALPVTYTSPYSLQVLSMHDSQHTIAALYYDQINITYVLLMASFLSSCGYVVGQAAETALYLVCQACIIALLTACGNHYRTMLLILVLAFVLLSIYCMLYMTRSAIENRGVDLHAQLHNCRCITQHHHACVACCPA